MSALFESMFNIAVIFVLLICLVFTLVSAMKRLIKHTIWHKFAVLTANTAAAVAIMGLVIGFHYSSAKPTMLVLITPNTTEYSIKQHQKLSSEHKLTWVVLASFAGQTEQANNLQVLDKDNVILINSVSQLSLHYPTLSEVTVLGDGLSKVQWQLLMSQYSPSNEPIIQSQLKVDEASLSTIYIQHKGYTPRLGLINMQWQSQLVVGQQTIITGQLQTTLDENNPFYNLTLLGPMNEEIESQIVSQNDTFSFTISANIPGQWLYELKLTKRTQPKLSVSEKLNVHIVNGKAIKLLVKQSSPSFETRHLQNTVAQQGGKVVTLTQISKNKDIRQQINVSEFESALLENPFSPSALNFFDVLIIDQQALSNLSAQQSEALEAAIKDGLGILIRVQPGQVDKWPIGGVNWLQDIKVSKTPSSNDSPKISYLRWQYQSLDTPISSIKANIEARNATTLVTDQNNNSVVLSREFGLGKVAVSLINTSYIWKTQGKADLHSHYWQWLFSQLGRTSALPQWQSKTHEAIKLAGQTDQQCIVNTQDISSVDAVQGALNIPVTINKQLVDVNTGCIHFSPPRPGWYSLLAQLNNQDPLAIALYASKATSWQASQQHKRYQATATIIRQQKQNSATAFTQIIRVSPYWFWALLMAASSMLWIERKYFS